MREIIKYILIVLGIVLVVVVFSNLMHNSNETFKERDNNNNRLYIAKIKLLDEDTKEYIEDSKLLVKDKSNKVIKEWVTTNNAYNISGLENGIYTLIQTEASKNYHLNENNIKFEIKNADKEVIMYNVKMTEEEIKEANTTKTEVGVDNTLSSKNKLISIVAIITIILGFITIYKVKKSY